MSEIVEHGQYVFFWHLQKYFNAILIYKSKLAIDFVGNTSMSRFVVPGALINPYDVRVNQKGPWWDVSTIL